jgi:hypothetical protein
MRLQPNSFTGLNKHLICSIYPMTRVGDGTAWERDDEGGSFAAPLTQASMEITPNWQSPFEGAGVESKFPELAQMSQAGMFQGVLTALGAKVSDEDRKDANMMGKLSEAARGLMGRSGVTKLNSTQVFSGMPPIKIQVTAFLRAFKDPWAEVEAPLKQLQEWTLPRHLAKDGVLAQFLTDKNVLSLMPSEVPTIVGFAYKNRIFQPMVIESVSDPLDAPIDNIGNRISASVQITLCTLTALDRDDWHKTYRSIVGYKPF